MTEEYRIELEKLNRLPINQSCRKALEKTPYPPERDPKVLHWVQLAWVAILPEEDQGLEMLDLFWKDRREIVESGINDFYLGYIPNLEFQMDMLLDGEESYQEIEDIISNDLRDQAELILMRFASNYMRD